MPNGAIHEQWSRLARADDALEGAEIGAHGLLPAVEFDEEQAMAAVELPAAGPLAGSGERERVGEFQGAREEARLEDPTDGARGGGGRREAHGQAGTRRRERKQFQSRFGDHSQKPLRAGKQAMQIEARLVLVRASSETNDRAVGQDDFQA